MASSDKIVTCEYFVQNGQEKNEVYKNIFIMPKRYTSMADIKQRDVIKAFPLKDRAYLLRFQ